MLILSRHEGEQVMLGSMLFTTLDVSEETVKFSIDISSGAGAGIVVRQGLKWSEGSEISAKNGVVEGVLRPDESISLSEEITIRVVDIRGLKVRWGFDNPLDFPVLRKEVYDAINRAE